MDAIALPYDSGSDDSLEYFANCRSCDVGWRRCKLLAFLWEFSIGEISDVLFRSVSSSRCCSASEQFIRDRMVMASPVLFVPGDRTSLQIIQVHGPQ